MILQARLLGPVCMRWLAYAPHAVQGVRGIYRGLVPTVLQVAPAMAFTVRLVAPLLTRRSSPLDAPLARLPTYRLQFWARGSCEQLFDTASKLWGNLQRRSELVPGSGATALVPAEQESPGYVAAIRSVASGAAAGTFGKFVVYPMDTVKKRLQVCRGVVNSAAVFIERRGHSPLCSGAKAPRHTAAPPWIHWASEDSGV